MVSATVIHRENDARVLEAYNTTVDRGVNPSLVNTSSAIPEVNSVQQQSVIQTEVGR